MMLSSNHLIASSGYVYSRPRTDCRSLIVKDRNAAEAVVGIQLAQLTLATRNGPSRCQWVQRHHNLGITGPTGSGKTWLACAIGNQACRHCHDWGIQKIAAAHRNDLMEIIEDRHSLRSTLIASQLPVEHWHEFIGEATLADAILDRLLHNAHRLPLRGESMRKTKTDLTDRDRSV